jgi:hypothetical protein
MQINNDSDTGIKLTFHLRRNENDRHRRKAPSSRRRPKAIASFPATRATSTEQVKRSRTNGRLSRCQSSSRSPKPSRPDTTPWSCLPPLLICAGVSWPGSGAETSTWTRARSASKKPFHSPTRAPCGPTRRSRRPVSASFRFPPRSPPRSGGTSSGSLSRGSGGSSLSDRRAASCAARIFHKSVWIKARERVGLPGLHFHDLRHTGGTLTAATGATLKELMARLGHSSVPGGTDLPARHPRPRPGHREGPRDVRARRAERRREAAGYRRTRGEGSVSQTPVWHVCGTRPRGIR